MAVTDNVASKLLTLDEVLQEQYYPTFLEQSFRKGRKTNLLIPFAAEGEFEVEGDGVNVQVERGYGDSSRPSNNPLSDFPTPRPFDPDKYKVRFSEADPSANDFTTINMSAKVTHLQLVTGGAGAIVDCAQRVFEQLAQDYQEKLATLRNLTRSGQLATVNGTPKQNNLPTYSASAATPTNTTGMRILIDDGSIAYFHSNMRLDFYTGATPSARNVRVTDVNYGEKSIGVEFLSTGDDQSSGNLASVADNDGIYFSESYGVGMYSLGAWFGRPTAGEVFIGGRDRTAAASRHLLTTAIREGASPTAITLDIFNEAARASNFVQEAEQTVVVVADTTMTDAVRSRLDDNAVIQQPPTGGTGGRIYEMGAMEVRFQHPQFGQTILMADPLMQPNKIRIIVPETWRSLWYGWRGPMMMPQGEGYGTWYRMEAATPGTGKGKIYKTDGYANHCDVCLQPVKNISIEAVTP